MSYKILEIDPYLKSHEKDINLRMTNYYAKRKELVGDKGSLIDFANGYEYFGIHKTDRGYVYREWAPNAEAMYFTGDFNGWDIYKNKMTNIGGGVFEITLEGDNAPKLGENVQAIVCFNGGVHRRVPSYATRVVQDPVTYLWCAQVDDVLYDGFNWTDQNFKPTKVPYIYECHIGMAQEKYGVGSYHEFTQKILPRIKDLGYNTIQIMAIMEHPYYGSFGYQVSNFYAPSSRFGEAKELKELINTAHEMGLTVLLDVVHSHAVKNVGEGLNLFDGTDYQYFHTGAKGNHSAWDTKLFNYGKNEVLHFLLSNLKYWMKIYHFDGFRFDGVTSMLYHDHGLGSAFTNYDCYFSLNTNTEAVTYLQLATELIHSINKKALAIAEDMSGMPGMCLPIKEGGLGFDFRLSMGMPDLWIKLIKEYSDENWDMGNLWYELTTRRPKEKSIGYAESHDQALVGDKTIIFRLCDAEMYTAMSKNSNSMVISRGIALHKMIRLITLSLAGEGYLNFMGNEFGHPEWIDFPREGNGWSYHYCRRQWSLADNPDLRYGGLLNFDKAMINFAQKNKIVNDFSDDHYIHYDDKIIIFRKGDNIFAFNFNPNRSFEGYFIKTEGADRYKVVLSTDQEEFGGFNRVDMKYKYNATYQRDGSTGFKTYLPSRTAVIFKKVKQRKKNQLYIDNK